MNKNTVRIWHRRLGVSSLLMILWLAVSGSLINHGDALGINKNTFNNALLNSLYGLENTISNPQAVQIDQSYFFCYQQNLYRDDQVITTCDTDLISAITINKQIFLLNSAELIVLDDQFLVLDKVPFSLLINSFEGNAFGSNGFEGNSFSDSGLSLSMWKNSLVLTSKEHKNYWKLDLLDLSVLRVDTSIDGVIESGVEIIYLPASLTNNLDYPGISLERVLLDVHSGRLFGNAGVLVVDFFALAFVFLALSGLWMFLKQSR